MLALRRLASVAKHQRDQRRPHLTKFSLPRGNLVKIQGGGGKLRAPPSGNRQIAVQRSAVHSNRGMNLSGAGVGQFLMLTRCRIIHGAAARPLRRVASGPVYNPFALGVFESIQATVFDRL